MYRGNGTGGWVAPYPTIGTGWNGLGFPGAAPTTSSSLPPLGKVTFADHVAQWNVLCSDDHSAQTTRSCSRDSSARPTCTPSSATRRRMQPALSPASGDDVELRTQHGDERSLGVLGSLADEAERRPTGRWVLDPNSAWHWGFGAAASA